MNQNAKDQSASRQTSPSVAMPPEDEPVRLIPQEVIRQKRDGQELSLDTIRGFFGGFLVGDVEDYQMTAFLMATLLRGMSARETADLTTVMRDSGEVLTWDYPRDLVVDKHSTGGIGDKTSLVLLPLCVIEGLYVPMIAGRGLGHTGGTLDKLESIPGMQVRLTTEKMRKLMDQHHGGFFGQTEEIAPLDRRIYSLRDVTATVESIPLITASILSKKLAEGIGGLVMDVKFGSGAFMREKQEAEALARMIFDTASRLGLNIRCCLTDMGSPLGNTAGNGLEIAEVIDILKDEGPADSTLLSIELAAHMICLARPDSNFKATCERLRRHLSSGKAFEVFSQIVGAQGGERRVLDDRNWFLKASVRQRLEVPAQFNNGCVIKSIDVRRLGIAIQVLGGGRRKVSDVINPFVGLTGLRRVGQVLEPGEPMLEIHAHTVDDAALVTSMLSGAFVLGDPGEAVVADELVWKVMEK
ncbi:MAG: hypothetical protein RIQ81_559 [Pseudomonadota bacterium]|jgi:pyrimidine-nucleoside phosphorylase